MKAVRKSDATVEWFTRADLRPYAGKYVAIVGRRVAAAGKNPKRVYELAQKRFPGKEIVLWKAIREDMLLL